MRKLLILFFFFAYAAFGQISACDLNEDSEINIFDYQVLIDMALGLAPCTANINGSGVCNIITVQRVINAAFGRGCTVDVPAPHSVTLTWTHSTSPDVMNYNIYRGEVSGGPYTLLKTVDYVNTWVDTSVSAGATYYYVATAVDGSENESAYSNQAEAVIPSP